MKYQPVYIEWWDHASFQESRWRDITPENRVKPFLCRTLGYVLHEDDQCVLVGQTYHEGAEEDHPDRWVGEMSILKGAINKRVDLKIK